MMEMGMEAWEKGYIVLRVWAIWHWAFETHGTGNIDYMVHVGNLCYIVRGTWTVLHSTLDQAGILTSMVRRRRILSITRWWGYELNSARDINY